MELFKGYVPTKNKKCLRKFKDAPLMSLGEVESLPEYAGILNDNTILIDIDDHEQSEILMSIVEDFQLDCRVYITTRGRHFLFRNDKKVTACHTGVKLACGLTADIKIGLKNSYSILKYNNEDRFIEWDIEEGHEYQALPNFLLPVKKTDIDLFNLGEGDGRNSVLFEYILTLNQLGISKDESRDILKLINKYVFKTPLDDSEIETITRDEAFPVETFQDKNGFRHDQFGDYLISQNHIVRINGQLHIYKNGVYVNALRDIELAMIKNLPKLKSNQRSEVLKYIDLKAETTLVSDAEYIAFKNGIYNIITETLESFSPDIVVTNQIPWNYAPESHSEVAERTLRKIACNDKEIVSLLEECIGYCFYRRNQLGKAFFLTGDKSNGKSTFLSMLGNLLGEKNTSSLDIGELDERFSVAGLAGKLANIGDDISDEFLQGRSIATFKKIVTGDRIKAEFKGENPFEFAPYVKLLFSANDIPRTKDKTGAVLRRMVIIPFNAIFSKDDPDYDPFIAYKLRDRSVMEYLARIGIEGLKRVLKNNGFSESGKVSSALREYETENNPILSFLEDVPESEIENQLTNEVYSRYRVFCMENNAHPISKASFSKELNRRCGMVSKATRINGKSIRVYKKEESATVSYS